MHRLNVCLVFVGLAAWTALLAGCGPSGPPPLKTEPVEGVVTLDGTPVEGATVTFKPVTEGQGMSATGVTDQQGVYKLTALATRGQSTAPPEGGTLPGEYYVGIVKTESASPAGGDEETQETDEEGRSVETKLKYIVPEKYKIPTKSGLKATVKEGPNKIDFELKSSGAAAE